MGNSSDKNTILSLSFFSTKLFLILLGICLVASSVFFWKAEEASNLAEMARGVETKARSYAGETEVRYARIYDAMTRLAARGAPYNEAGVGSWKADAAFYIDSFYGLKSVAWVDDAFRIREIVPIEGNTDYIGQIANDAVFDPLQVNLWVPSYDAIEFQGFILGIVSIDSLISPIIDEIDDDYALQLLDGATPVYTTENWHSPQEETIAKRTVSFKNATVLNLSLVPTEALRAAGVREARGTLAFGLLLSFIAMLAVSFAQNYLGKAKSSELRYQNLFKSSKDAIFVTDLSGAFQDANLAATSMLGYSLAELQNLTVSDLLVQTKTVPTDTLPQSWQVGANREAIFRHKDGHAIPVDLGASVIGEATDQEIVLAIVRDITERKAAENELHQYREHLEAIVAERTRDLQDANDELESFSYSVSHDLRAPLRHIDGFLRLLEEREAENLDPTSQHFFQNVKEASTRMGQLIDDLLKFSRTSRSEMTFSPVDPVVLIEKVIGDLQPSIADREIVWTIEPLPTIMADSSLLRVVWTNLLANAIKFTRGRVPTKIDIGTLPDPHQEGWVTFYVRDNGVGFDPAYTHNLFGVFQRLHQQSEFEGTGIGLATVRRIIYRHDGNIWAEAVEGKGATFFFTLKLAR